LDVFLVFFLAFFFGFFFIFFTGALGWIGTTSRFFTA
jgi:hypothetical protein